MSSQPFIKVSHPFSKLRYQTKARLVYMTVVDAESLHRDFIEYDSLYYPYGFHPKYSQIPSAGKVIVLYLIGNKMIPFSSIRKHTPEKELFYRSLLGKILTIVIKKPLSSKLKTAKCQ
jgi:hypothetical protein